MGHNPKGTDLLRAEHQVIMRALKVLDVLCEELENKKKVPIEHLKQVLDFITLYADEYHHGHEENILLPFLNHCSFSTKLKFIEEIVDEHLLHRGYVDAMADALANSVSSVPPHSFTNQARNLIGLLSEHILKEDNLLLPEAESIFSEQDQQTLFNKLTESETEIQKSQNKIFLHSIAELEKIYLPATATDCCGCGLGR